VVNDKANQRQPVSPPKPPGSTFKPFTATALGGSDDLHVFQAAPLTNGGNGGLGSVPGVPGAQIISNAASLSANSNNNNPLNSLPIGTEDNVRILGQECGDPCRKQRRIKALEDKLDAIKDAITEQSQQIQADNNWVASTTTLIEQHENKIALVREHADKVKSDVRELLAKKQRFESILMSVRAREQHHVKQRTSRGSKGEVYSAIVEGYTSK